MSSYTQSGSNGADVTGTTGVNVIVGTGYADTIRAGDGADVITAGGGNDTITLGTGDHIVNFLSTAAATPGNTDGADTITGFDVGDIIGFSASVMGVIEGTATVTDGTTTLGSDATTATTNTGSAVSAADGKFSIAYNSSTGITTLAADLDTDGTATSYLEISLVGDFSGLDNWTFVGTGIEYTA